MKKFCIAITLCQILLFVSCQTLRSTGQEIIIPMDMTTHRPIVEVMIDGKGPYQFIFDTGSSANVIDENLQEAFGFEVVGEDPLQTPGSENRLVSPRVAVPKIHFPGTNLFKDAEMNVIALRRTMLPIDGILGGFFLKDYLATMDYPGGKLILTTGELKKNDSDVTSFIQNARNLNLNINVDGNNVEAHLDSGNPHTITLPYSLKDKLTFKETPKKGLPMRTPVASFNTWEAELVGSITIGNAVFENPPVRLAEGFEFVNLGYGVINELRTTIDRKNSLIKFERVKRVHSGNKKEKPQVDAPSSPFSGTYEGERKIWVNESGKLVYQRPPAPMPLELVQIEGDLYEVKIPTGVRAPMEIPNVLFVKNENKEIIAIELVYKDGRKDGPFKRVSK